MYANNAFSVGTSVEEVGGDKPDEYLRVNLSSTGLIRMIMIRMEDT